MKIILSRKGFDSTNGEQASPILPDGKLLSLPIPSLHGETIKYVDLRCGGKTYFDIIKELNPNTKINGNSKCHADPDIYKEILPRPADWLGLFGQYDSSQGHLHKHKVDKGDIFLFFGWFKQSAWTNGTLTYAQNAADQHILFGYLQVGAMYLNTDINTDIKNNTIPPRIQNHPHCLSHYKNNVNNCIYEASGKLTLDGSLPGYGVFKYDTSLVLTQKGASQRTHWALPGFFNAVNITYHPNHPETTLRNGYFQSTPRGQEFIIDCDKKTAVTQQLTQWALDKIKTGMK